MSSTALRHAIRSRAWWWSRQGFHETSTNRGPGVDDVHRYFDGGLSREAYCAKFAFVVVDQACRLVGARNVLPKTAGARDLRDRSKKVLRVDTTPAEAAVFYRKSSCSKCTGHIGICYFVGDSKVMWSVEGNNNDRIDLFSTTWAEVRDPRNGYVFIHTEEMQGGALQQAGFGLLPLILVGGAAAGLYYYGTHS